jgi:hypothetical protein
MAQAYTNLSKFKAVARTTGFAKQNKYEVEILPPAGIGVTALNKQYYNAILNCELASFPSLNILTRQLFAQGPAYQRPTGIDFSGEGIPLTFILDQSMGLKAFFDAWLFKVVNPYSAEVSYRDQYTSTVRIKQLNELEQSVYEITLYEAFPRSISLLDLSASSQNSFHKLTVNFTFRKWLPTHELFQTFDLSPGSDISGNRILTTDPYKKPRSGTTVSDKGQPNFITEAAESALNAVKDKFKSLQPGQL